MSDDHSLPILPRESTPPPFFTASSRKKSRGYASSSSSDAPFFSSDDLAEASVTNYESPRRKRQQKRAWWQADDTQPTRSRHAKRAAVTRPKDSGVFMSSDSSADDGFPVEPLNTTSPRRIEKQLRNLRQSEQRQTDPLELADRKIFECCDRGHPVVDLSGIGLSILPSSSIRPLRDLILQPKFQSSPTTDETYQTFTPSTELYLSSNALRSFPTEILNLTNLTALSIRNNGITELPHSFGRLHNLKELNVGSNKLRWLPWELVHLAGHGGNLANLHIHPNPFIQPFSPKSADLRALTTVVDAHGDIKAACTAMSSVATTEEHKLVLSWIAKIHEAQCRDVESVRVLQDLPPRNEPPRLHPVYLGATQDVCFDNDGRTSRLSSHSVASVARSTSDEPIILPPSAEPASMARLAAEQRAGLRETRVPSLFELSLRACADALSSASASQLLRSEYEWPPAVTRALETVQTASSEGGWKCSVCCERFILPRVESLEYWHCGSGSIRLHSINDIAVPFLRRLCSMGCAASLRIT